jgi:hypothetical protein
VAVGLILALDWRYGDLNPQREFERFRAHPLVATLLRGSVTIATGAKTIPEGGYHALGRIAVPGALVVGDGAGFVNMEQIKGSNTRSDRGSRRPTRSPTAGRGGCAGCGDPARRLRAPGGAWRPVGSPPRPQLPPGVPLGPPAGDAAVGSSTSSRAGLRSSRTRARCDPGRGSPSRPCRAGTGDVPEPERRAHREDEPHMTILDPDRCARCDADFASRAPFARPRSTVVTAAGSPQPVELPPLHDLHRQVPGREHRLAAARRRRARFSSCDEISHADAQPDREAHDNRHLQRSRL